jgi:D-alanyl-D-alanine endopeptidase (penicillin-binding protein 7)
MFKKISQKFSLQSFSNDTPIESIGSLIPQLVKEKNLRQRRQFSSLKLVAAVGAPVLGVAAFTVLAVSGYGLVASNNLASVPTVNIFDTTTDTTITLPYGPLPALAQISFFEQTREAFIEDEVTFIEVDLDAQLVRFFEAGILTQTAEVLATGVEGSWWDAPSGLYTVKGKSKNSFSNVNQVYLPWSITFEGNYAIHGLPAYPNQAPVTEAFVGGGIRLNNQAAEALFAAVDVDVPVLVYKKAVDKSDDFAYVPTAPEISTERYLVVDIDNGTILATGEAEEAAPVASLTKLMTAVVAAERLNLDSRVQVTAPTFVMSLIPRLSERTSVSMYSLLQLLLVESSNEAAEVIAGEYGREDFVQAMNDKARQLGMLQTTFADPSGISPQNISSPKDLYLLTSYIHSNRQFIFDITAKKEVTVIGSGEFTNLDNFNEVDDITSFVGGKVGETSAAGQTLVSVHELEIQDSIRTIVVVLLGSTSRKDDLRTLLRYVEEEFN